MSSPEASDVALHASRKKANSAHVLRSILAQLKHLDLTGRIRFESAVMKSHGGYADVFIGYVTLVLESASEPRRSRAPEEVKVAIKRLRIHIQGDSDFAKCLSKEIRVWSRLKHRNVLAFLGYALEGEDYPLLISEWMENGTAMSYVTENPGCHILPMVFGIAKGLAYLHSQGVVHADMKADNVLVSADGQPRICDFGISSVLAASSTFGATSSHNYGTRGSLRWMAIEFFDMAGPPILHSEKTDVWAFGMTVYELLARQIPYAHIKLDPQVLLTIMQGILPAPPGAFPDLPHYAYQRQVWDICCECWKSDPGMRPSMASIVRMLSIVQSLVAQSHDDDEIALYSGDPPYDLWIRTQEDFITNQEALNSGDPLPEARNLLFSTNLTPKSQTTIVQEPSSPMSFDEPYYQKYLGVSLSSSTRMESYEWGPGKPWSVRFKIPSLVSLLSGSSAGGGLTLSPGTNASSSSLPLAENQVLKEGYLAEVTDDPVYRLYTSRYYVLVPSSLKYYRQLGGELLGTINVIGAQLPDEPGRNRGYDNALLLISQRSMGLSDEASLRILYAESQSECNDWVLALQQAADRDGYEEPSRRRYTLLSDWTARKELGSPGGYASASTLSVGTLSKSKQKGKPAVVTSWRSSLLSFFGFKKFAA